MPKTPKSPHRTRDVFQPVPAIYSERTHALGGVYALFFSLATSRLVICARFLRLIMTLKRSKSVSSARALRARSFLAQAVCAGMWAGRSR